MNKYLLQIARDRKLTAGAKAVGMICALQDTLQPGVRELALRILDDYDRACAAELAAIDAPDPNAVAA